MHLKLRYVVPVILLIVIGVGAVWLFGSQAPAEASVLRASGTVEAVEVSIASEVPGRIAEVLVAEGERVMAGQPLIRLDDELLQGQMKQAEAALAAAEAQQAAAQANLDLLMAGVQPEEIASAEEAVKAAEAAVAAAEAQLAQLQTGVSAADIAAAEAAVAQTAAQRKVAQDAYDQTLKCFEVALPGGGQQKVCPGLGTLEEQARAALAAANEAYAAAQERLDQLKRGATKNELDAARAQVEAAQAQKAMAQSQLDLLRGGARPEQVSAAQAQVDAAQAQVDAASAGLDVLRLQIEKLTLTAPSDGVVLTRAVEPGEVTLPGATLLTLGQIDSLTITVYVPENQYGQVSLGQAAQVTVDSFPDQAFAAEVVHIADRAEFTPRNVQTAEGRATTVYGVKLAVDNVDGKLKPGMPADVAFGQ